MAEQKNGFVLGTSAGPGVPVKKKEDKKPAEIVPAKPTALATVADKKAVSADAPKKAQEKKTTKKSPAKKADKPKKTEAKKTGRPKKVVTVKDEIKAIADTVSGKKEEEKKTPAAKKTTTASKVKVAPAKPQKVTKTANVRKPATKEIKTNVVLQYADYNISYDTIVENAQKSWKSQGKRAAVKSMDLYVKPEESRVYFVVNGKDTGDCELYLQT